MTENEICKALEACSTDASKHMCDGCPYNYCEDLSCADQVCKDAAELIKKQQEKIAALTCINTLQEQDLADRDEMLKQKVEVVYADFMKDYECIKEENEGLYKENADQRAEIERLQKALVSINYIAKRIPQTVCDHCYPDFNRDGLPVNVWKAQEGYEAVDALVEQIAKEAMT